MMTDLQVLMAARKLLMDPKRWTKNILATKQDGETCYCALGAIGAACGVQWTDANNSFLFPLSLVNHDHDVEVQWHRVSKILDRYVELPEGADMPSDEDLEDCSSVEASAPAVAAFNDWATTKYEDVMSLFSRAIQALVADGAAQEQEVVAA